MSSSYPDPVPSRAVDLRAAVAAVAALLAADVSMAADTYFIPEIDLRAEYNSNFAMEQDDGGSTDLSGAILDAQALIGIDTPRSKTSIRPRLKWQEYPDSEDTLGIEPEPLEAFLFLRSEYEWERSNALVIGRYSLQDSINSETPSGVFDPLDPLFGSDPDAAKIFVGETVERFELRPTFTHAVTERVRAGAELLYQGGRYDSEGVENNTDFDYSQFEGFLVWALNPVSDVTAGAYVAKYEAKDDSAETDSYGGRVRYAYRWSKVAGLEATLFHESSDITDFVPVRSEESTSDWGGTLTAYRRQDVGAWRFTLGRRFIPTGSGGKATSDQLRLQYDRDLSERMVFSSAARYETQAALTEAGARDDRDYARVDLSLEWMLTPTWYVGGGYSYIWQDREEDPSAVDNNRVYLSVGYRGLQRPRR